MKGFGFIGAAAIAFAVTFISPARANNDFTMAHDMDWYVAALGGKVDRDRQDAEVALSILAVKKYDGLSAELQKPSLNPESAKRLKVILAREKPRNDARKVRAAQFAADSKWNVDSALDGYTKFGNTNPKWDEDAKKGINIYTHAAGGAQREPLERAIRVRDSLCGHGFESLPQPVVFGFLILT